jgi:hypothetical protein
VSRPLRELDEGTRREVAELFRAHGVDRDVSILQPVASDEVIFVVEPKAAALMREGSLSQTLTELLGRKVWISTSAEGWGSAERLEPFPLD